MTQQSVTFVVAGLSFGGAEVQVVELCARIQARGWRPSVVSLIPPTALTERLDEIGVPWVHLGARKGRYSPRLLPRLHRAIRQFQPTVVHSHTLPANFAVRLVRPFVDAPVVVTSAHNINEGGRARMLFYRLTDGLTDLTTNCSVSAVERYVAIKAAPADRIRYVPNGIDTQRFRADPVRRAEVRAELGLDDQFTWLAVGRMDAAKDWPNLLEACTRTLRTDDRLLVVGQGPLTDEVQRDIDARGLSPRIRMLGLRPDVPDLMRAADAYVMSSAWEGLPMVLLEAGASSLPTVATSVGGVDQLVIPGETGFLVPPKNADALGRAMLALRNLPDTERRALGEGARAHVESRYGIDAVAEQWLAIYAELLEQTAVAA